MTLMFKGMTVAGVVGTLLLCINQYDALIGAAPIRLVPAVLSYCVPFLVFLTAGFHSHMTADEFVPRKSQEVMKSE